MNGLQTIKEKQIAGKRELEAIERQIAENAPALHELTKEQLEQIANIVLINSYADTMKRDIETIAADYRTEKNTFIEQRKSEHTKKGYQYAFNAFETYLQKRGIDNPLKCTPELADGFILDMKKQGKAAATIRRNIAAISSFFRMITRYHPAIRNPFAGIAGTGLLPKKENAKRIESEIPTGNLKTFKKDILTIIKNETCNELKVMLYFMAFRGLRAGAFENMNIDGNRFYTTSKGKRIGGELPEICIQALKEAGLKKTAPFAEWTTAKISAKLEYHVLKLYRAGKIGYRYSPHDLRHFYALTEYTKNKDIYALKNLLNHCSIAVTEIYLQGLGVDLKKTA